MHKLQRATIAIMWCLDKILSICIALSVLLLAAGFLVHTNHVFGDSIAVIQYLSSPTLHDMVGDKIDKIEVGQQSMIGLSIHNAIPTEQNFVIWVEIRDGSDVTTDLFWQTGVIKGNGNYTMETSWTPRNLCGYYEGCENREIRSFVLSSLTDPQILSSVYAKSGIAIIGSQPKSPFIEHHYELFVNEQTYDIGYSFSDDEDGRLVNVAVDADSRTMLLSLVTPKDSLFTIMIPKPLFDSIFIGSAQEGVGLYTLVDGVEIPFEQIIDFDKASVTYIISIEEGTEEIELGGKVGFESRFLGYYGSQIISLEMGAVERNNTENVQQINRIAKSFNSCDRALIYMSYGQGSMKVGVVGLDGQEQCGLAIVYEIEMGVTKLDCSVPMQVMRDWSSWRNAAAPQFEEVSEYCRQK